LLRAPSRGLLQGLQLRSQLARLDVDNTLELYF